MKLRTLLIASASVLALFTSAHAAENDANVIILAKQMQKVHEVGIRHGYTWAEDLTVTSNLSHGRQKSHRITLRRGMQYKIVGICDGDCKDLDLELHDENGNPIDKDYDSDDYPEVNVTPRRSAEFKVTAQMERCTANPCGYILMVLKK